MASRAQTFLTKYATPVAEDLLLKIGSFKVMISAGVIALSKLSADQREQAISEANGANKEIAEPPLRKVNIGQSIEDVTYYVKFKLPSPEEQKKLSELRKELGPELKKRRKKTKIS